MRFFKRRKLDVQAEFKKILSYESTYYFYDRQNFWMVFVYESAFTINHIHILCKKYDLRPKILLDQWRLNNKWSFIKLEYILKELVNENNNSRW